MRPPVIFSSLRTLSQSSLTMSLALSVPPSPSKTNPDSVRIQCSPKRSEAHYMCKIYKEGIVRKRVLALVGIRELYHPTPTYVCMYAYRFASNSFRHGFWCPYNLFFISLHPLSFHPEMFEVAARALRYVERLRCCPEHVSAILLCLQDPSVFDFLALPRRH